MEMSKEIFQNEEKIIRAKKVVVEFADFMGNHAHFNVIDPDTKKIKYMGQISINRNHSDFCTCPDNFHRNTENYKKTHALSYQCIHQIAYHEFLINFRKACKILESEKDTGYNAW